MRSMIMTDALDYRTEKALMFVRDLRDDIGQAFVELALILPIFVLLLVGAAELGHLAYASIEVSNAARAGVQYGAQSHITASDYAGMQTAATKDGSDVTVMSATAKHFCGCSDGSASTCASGDCAASRLLEYVQVNTTAAVHTLFHYPGVPATLTLTGQAVMRVEQ